MSNAQIKRCGIQYRRNFNDYIFQAQFLDIMAGDLRNLNKEISPIVGQLVKDIVHMRTPVHIEIGEILVRPAVSYIIYEPERL